MAFKVIKDKGNAELTNLPVSSQSINVGDLLELANGATTWTVATSSSVYYTKKAIAAQAVTTAATSVLARELTGFEWVAATSTNTASASHNGDTMVLTDKTAVNNTGTTSTAKEVVFIQRGLGSTTTEIIGHVLVGNGLIGSAT